MMITERQSNTFWAIKAFAIFSVFFAHMPGHSFNEVIFDRIGMIGVPLFMICAGFFYRNVKEQTMSDFFKKKLYSIVFPWLIWGTLTYIVRSIHILQLDISSYCKWVMGIGSWLYFVPVLLCCQLLSRYINKYILFALGLISMSLSFYNLIPYNSIFTPYINPFNFIGYFIIGQYLQLSNKWMSIKPVFGLLLIFSVLAMVWLRPIYWFPYSLLISLIIFIAVFVIIHYLNISVLNNVGKWSFVIYLSHIQIAGFLDNLLRFLWGSPFEFLKVIIAFMVVFAMVFGLRYFLKLLRFNSLEQLLGYR